MNDVFKVLISIRNSLIAKQDNVSIKINSTKTCFSILRLLYEEGFILTYIYDSKKKEIHIKNNIYKNKPMISILKLYNKVSFPIYLKYTDLCAIHKFGVDLLILSTTKGFLPHYKALKYKLGGKLICYIR